jgi:hypothetical protein
MSCHRLAKLLTGLRTLTGVTDVAGCECVYWAITREAAWIAGL